ncbi:zinc finger imprinted 3-like [Centruroides sculpturatus]|uniref:zinc finger imprinted 3-like n=1 Tax=Centruroides sculpturatus TaxID=218467 RepID=UPI000C6CFAD7|nr:zinc finger imprinted 3-like [Centruroides sculpturatus]XP_023222845.1 zinc finger imprinted 3-like [Centruroides sculpturatus]XP_023222847.1 zinc finger imprinted 3-like [Centruroides sculpturatus]XP_023222848.1 zinc finger imprinted 3-like [Centruroides sculpturatus]XP_023222849.1 zinc finger imprinted 3-like [Centruroides sculpturatus]
MSCSTIYCDIVNVGNIGQQPLVDILANVSALSRVSVGAYQVFSEVKATLTAEVIKMLPMDIRDILQKYSISAKLGIELENGSTHHSLYGNLEDIIEAYSKLQYYLSENTKYFNNESTTMNDLNILINKNTDGIDVSKQTSDVLNFRQEKEKSNTQKSMYRFKKTNLKQCSKMNDNQASSVYQTEQDLNDNLNSRASRTINNEENNTSETLNMENKKKNYEKSSPYKYFCDLCSFKTKRSSHFAKHSAIHKKVSSLYKCNKCPFTTIRLGHLRRHQTFHSTFVHRCKQCRYQTDNAKFLMRHVRQRHNRYEERKQAEVWECSHCPYKTSRQYYFDRHQQTHKVKDLLSPLHRCDKCCYSTKRKEHYIRHMNNVHGNQRPYLCHLCGKAFKRGDALRQHHITHSDNEKQVDTNIKCDICEKVFRSHSHLYEHRAVHSTTRSFLCEICGASFKTRSVQRKHVLSIHKNPRAFSCHICDKRFNTQYAMKRHQKIHIDRTVKEKEGSADANVDDTTTVVALTSVANDASSTLTATTEYIAAGFDPTATSTLGHVPETATALLYLTSDTGQY